VSLSEIEKKMMYFTESDAASCDIKPASEHPTRDSFKLLGIGMLIALGIGLGIGIAAVFSAKYNIDIDPQRFGKYVGAVVLVVFLFASGTFRTLYRVAAVWFHRGKTQDDRPD
jgi:hypothetical protein